MRWLACACLLVVGCFEPPTMPPYRVRLISADPPVVPVHGGESVIVQYEGVLPEGIAVDIDGMFSPIIDHDVSARLFTVSSPVHVPGPVSIGVIDVERGVRLALEESLLAYEVFPGLPALSVASDAQTSFAWPLHPELARPCARGGQLYLSNFGDEPLTLSGVRSSSDAFVIDAPACGPLAYSQSCVFDVCFNTTVPGVHNTILTASTSAGDSSTTVEATVMAPTSGLDASFDGGGVAFDGGNDYASSEGSLGASGILTWANNRVIAIDASGVETHRDLSVQIGPSSTSWIQAMRRSSSGIYVLVVSSASAAYAAIVPLDDALVPAAKIDLPYESGALYYDLQITPSGRLLAITSRGIVAIANGVVDTTYGTNGRVLFPAPFAHQSLVDSQGRLYAGVVNQFLRFTANGTLEGSYGSIAEPDALAIDSADRVYVQHGTRISRLADTGIEDFGFNSSVYALDLAVDASGRIYSTGGTGIVSRFFANGVYEGTVGFGSEADAICPASGACYLLGVLRQETIPFSSGPPSYLEKYVLRLAN